MEHEDSCDNSRAGSGSWLPFIQWECQRRASRTASFGGSCKQEHTVNLLMDKAYEDDKTQFTAWWLKFNPVVPLRRDRKNLWEYDKELYKRRNEIEKFFRRLKAYRGIGTRYDKLDVIFTAFIWLVCICILLRSVNTPQYSVLHKIINKPSNCVTEPLNFTLAFFIQLSLFVIHCQVKN